MDVANTCVYFPSLVIFLMYTLLMHLLTIAKLLLVSLNSLLNTPRKMHKSKLSQNFYSIGRNNELKETSSNLPSPTGLLIQYGHEHNYNPADDNFISVTFEKSYTQWVQVFCNIPATMTTGYFHISTAHSITLTGCKLKGKAIKIENLAIVLEMETPSEGIQWVAIGV